MQQVQVLVAQGGVRCFDYAVPSDLDVKVGDIVTVPFGKRQVLGCVWGKAEGGIPLEKIKPIAARCDVSALSAPFRKFLSFVSAYTSYPLGNVLKMVLPVPYREGEAFEDPKWQRHSIALRGDQQLAYDAIAGAVHDKSHQVFVLDGVTGSGKTEIYLQAIFDMIENGDGQAVVLLPEICLSTQLLARFERYSGVRPHIWHSNLTPKQRQLTWKGIAQGKIRLVVGARSALFLPFTNLACVVVDEEHDGSYKQEEGGVVYHGRDMAIARGHYESCPVVLASATPSLETIANVRLGKYEELTLSMRHGDANPPEIHIADMRNQEKHVWVSDVMRQAIAKHLEKGQQVLLFLNRRGYAPLTLCRTCGHRWMCTECDSWLVEHRKKGKQRLICHHCGKSEPVPTMCPECESEDSIVACGPGVERVAEEMETAFPEARIAMMTKDTISTHKQAEALVHDILDEKVDIIVGTQMVAKGHHFPKLSFVGVVDADIGLQGGDVRASERSYQLLHQVAGRAGRESTAGEVWIQTYFPDSHLITALKESKRSMFIDHELSMREQHRMPPFSRLVALVVSGKQESAVRKWCSDLAAHMPRKEGVMILGPVPAVMHYLRGRYRFRFLVSGSKESKLQLMVREWLDRVPAPSSIQVKVDVDPIHFM